ncbi:30S ribosomal protein S11 [Candidatus Falkowbacteria bacterium CG11_big_fil_rev_8_21_14_0_20_39_10]|uniref:Small ribosomal subunit protein uS11 n=1 Tax=Candidatus Falkowbacteria bacterium CG11_big_fil_rev_8_21_14_0_20_39_10 TaxID=1974570 RepID=A0A2M6K8F0_9BACT|nr:MAG: 30S ribosomal protein S11 [Candidatus Falkowbacteria bacterium CG11_big_fil_rev_8_21_14_0_20_39_10]
MTEEKNKKTKENKAEDNKKSASANSASVATTAKGAASADKEEKAVEKTDEVKVEKKIEKDAGVGVKDKVEKKAEGEEKIDVSLELEDEKDFSTASGDDDLPDDIKKKLEKNKIERAKKKHAKKKKRQSRRVPVGKAYVKATYNNTVVTLTDLKGDVLSWASAGLAGFRGAKKATPYAAQIITKIASMKAKEEYGLEEVSVYVRGVGTGRESAVRALNANGFNITLIKDITPLPHNGCRPKKPRRV